MRLKAKSPRPSRRTVARLILALFLSSALLSATTIPLLACDISVTASQASGVVGDRVVVTVTVYQTHRTCTVPIDETKLDLSGLTLVSETQWRQVSSMIFEKEVVVELAVDGEGRVEVVRACPKGGDTSHVTIAVASSEPVVDGTDDVAIGDTSTVDGVAEEPPIATHLPEPTGAGTDIVDASTGAPDGVAVAWWETLGTSFRQPQMLVLLVLMAIGASFLFLRRAPGARPFAMLVSIGVLGFYVGGCPCPIGSLQNVIIYARDPVEHMTAYVQFGSVLLATLLFGRVFCGWACPLGATQFFLFRREKTGKNRRLEIPLYSHRILRWSKYGVLVVLVVLVVLTGQPVFQDIDPFRSLFNLDFRWGVPLVFLLVVLTASIVIGFPFCKYACPLGALLGLLQPLSLFKLRFSSSCTNCRLCSSVACNHGAIEQGATCPSINQMECVRCGECLSRCPSGAITFRAGR